MDIRDTYLKIESIQLKNNTTSPIPATHITAEK